jgi:hypothetical protein
VIVEPPNFWIWMLHWVKWRVGRGVPTLHVSFAKHGKWLRIGCRLGQENSNLVVYDSNDFNNLGSLASSTNP